MSSTDNKTSAHKIRALKYGTWGDTRHFLDRAAEIAAAGEAALRGEIEALRAKVAEERANVANIAAGELIALRAERDRLAADLAVARVALSDLADIADLASEGHKIGALNNAIANARAALARIAKEADNG